MCKKLGTFASTYLLNKRLLLAVQKNTPDILFIIKGNQILVSTLRVIKKMYPHVKLIHFYPDNPFCFWNGNSNEAVLNGLPYIDLFWDIHWDEHTPKQEKVLSYMRKNGYEAICEVCFHDKAEG